MSSMVVAFVFIAAGVMGMNARGPVLFWRVVTVVGLWISLLWVLRRRSRREEDVSRSCWVASTVFAIVIPGAYERYIQEEQLSLAEKYLHEGRLVRFIEVAEPLVRWDASLTIDKEPISRVAAACKRQVAERQRMTTEPLDGRATVEDRLTMARRLATLDEWDRAERLLRSPLLANHWQAHMLLGAVLQKQKRYEESIACYRSGIELLKSEEQPRTDALVRAVDAIAFNLREMRQYREAEQTYLQALITYPFVSIHWHLQLGRHYMQGGRYGEAEAHLENAARSSAAIAEQARAELAKLQTQLPACVLGRRK